jgi:hypothetical protein
VIKLVYVFANMKLNVKETLDLIRDEEELLGSLERVTAADEEPTFHDYDNDNDEEATDDEEARMRTSMG